MFGSEGEGRRGNTCFDKVDAERYFSDDGSMGPIIWIYVSISALKGSDLALVVLLLERRANALFWA
jgi:hypothetical protein